jgi:ABC-type multidrug transport system fused ATPase/permease subunit
MILLRSERRQFVILIVSDVIISIVDIAALFFLLWTVQFYIEPLTQKKWNPLPLSMMKSQPLLFMTLFFTGFALKNMAAFLISKAHFNFSSQVAIRMSENNLVRYQQGSFKEFVEIDSSEHVRRIAFQPFEFCQQVLTGIQQMITQVSLITLTLTAIFILHPFLFIWLSCILLPPVIMVFYIMKKRVALAKRHIRSANEVSYRYLFEALKGYVEGNIFNRNQFFLKRFIRARRQFSKYLFSTLGLQTMPGRIIETFTVMGLFILVTLAQGKGANDNTTFFTIGTFMAGAYKLIPGIVKLINLSGQVRAFQFSMDELQPYRAQSIPLPGQSQQLQSIQVKDLHFQYNGHVMLQNFSFGIQRGDFVGISGKSGRGKTTLLNLLLGFLEQKQGQIIVNGGAAEHKKACWHAIAYVKQQPFILHDTLIRNITLEEEGFDLPRLNDALTISGLDKVIKQFPGGLQMVISENGKNISGGQQQRIALARALYKNADMFLLDEPFSELDETSENELLKHFQILASRGKIIVMITHNKKSLSYCTKTISLDET